MTPEERLAQMVEVRAARKDRDDLPRSLSERELRNYAAESMRQDASIRVARGALRELAALPSTEPDERWLAHLPIWRKALCDELLAIQSSRDRASRDRSAHLESDIKYAVNGERRSFALLRPIVDTAAQDAIRERVLEAYAEYEERASVTAGVTW
jgi:hypothetical protein